MFPEEGYSFCLADGSIPTDECGENYIDIGGEYYNESAKECPITPEQFEAIYNDDTDEDGDK